MLKQIWLENLLFIDIETVTQQASYSDLDDDYKSLWGQKAKFFRDDNEPESSYFNRGSLYSEYSKIVCISVAYLKKFEGNKFTLRLKSFYGDDEAIILEDFRDLISNYYYHRRYIFCGHNIKEFDMPFICRRMIVNGIRLPHKLDQPGSKPPMIPILDTFLIWKFGEHKNYTSLRLLLKTLDIGYPEKLAQGNVINDLFWTENDLEGIKEHCQKDVIAVAQLLLRFKGFELLTPTDIQLSGTNSEKKRNDDRQENDDSNNEHEEAHNDEDSNQYEEEEEMEPEMVAESKPEDKKASDKNDSDDEDLDFGEEDESYDLG